MARSGSTPRGMAVSLPLRTRLKAWWHGYDLEVIRRFKGFEPLENNHGVSFEAELQPWEKPELLVPQLIWGEGFLTPGGASRTAELVKPLGLDESMSVLDIGSHLGGQARLIARDFGSWVTGVETDPELTEVAKLMSEKEGLGKKALVHRFEPSSVEFRQNAFDVAVSTDALYRIEDKETLLSAVDEALKGRSQIMIADYVRDSDVADSTALDAWVKAEPGPVHLWTERDYRSLFTDLKFDLRICSDVTDTLRSTILASFSEYLKEAATSGVEDRLRDTLVGEVERWMRLVAALDSGAVKALRLHAFRAQRSSLLSDW